MVRVCASDSNSEHYLLNGICSLTFPLKQVLSPRASRVFT